MPLKLAMKMNIDHRLISRRSPKRYYGGSSIPYCERVILPDEFLFEFGDEPQGKNFNSASFYTLESPRLEKIVKCNPEFLCHTVIKPAAAISVEKHTFKNATPLKTNLEIADAALNQIV